MRGDLATPSLVFDRIIRSRSISDLSADGVRNAVPWARRIRSLHVPYGRRAKRHFSGTSFGGGVKFSKLALGGGGAREIKTNK